MVGFPSNFAEDTKILHGYNFAAPLIYSNQKFKYWKWTECPYKTWCKWSECPYKTCKNYLKNVSYVSSKSVKTNNSLDLKWNKFMGWSLASFSYYFGVFAVFKVALRA